VTSATRVPGSWWESWSPPSSHSADKAERELGWVMRPLPETILDTAAILTAHHLVSA
jgi:hypothetical protein